MPAQLVTVRPPHFWIVAGAARVFSRFQLFSAVLRPAFLAGGFVWYTRQAATRGWLG